ncbi:hypothetical protein ES703_22167 [subsurface metagenome]
MLVTIIAREIVNIYPRHMATVVSTMLIRVVARIISGIVAGQIAIFVTRVFIDIHTILVATVVCRAFILIGVISGIPQLLRLKTQFWVHQSTGKWELSPASPGSTTGSGYTQSSIDIVQVVLYFIQAGSISWCSWTNILNPNKSHF